MERAIAHSANLCDSVDAGQSVLMRGQKLVESLSVLHEQLQQYYKAVKFKERGCWRQKSDELCGVLKGPVASPEFEDS